MASSRLRTALALSVTLALLPGRTFRYVSPWNSCSARRLAPFLLHTEQPAQDPQ